MNMKKIAILALSLCMIAAIAVTGTIAYFMDEDAENNVFTMGNVEIDLQEEFDQNSNLQPGLNIDKNIRVQNTGSNDAYVRVHIAIPSELDDGNPDFNASKNFLHFNFDKDSVVYGQWSWIPEYTTGTGYLGNGQGNWNFYEQNIDGKDYNVYVVTYRSALASGEITGTDAITNVYLDKTVNAEADYEKDENGEDVVKSYRYWDTKGNEVTYTAEEASNIQIKVIAEGAQTATFENAYDALNTAFGVPGTYNPWN